MTGTTLHAASRTLSAWDAGIVLGGRQRVVIAKPHALLEIRRDSVAAEDGGTRGGTRPIRGRLPEDIDTSHLRGISAVQPATAIGAPA